MKVKASVVTILLLVFSACHHNPPQPPPQPPVPECEVWQSASGCNCPEGTELLEEFGVCGPFRVDNSVNLWEVRGITAFSLALRDIPYIVQLLNHVKNAGWDPLILRVGTQTAGDWCESGTPGYLPCGPPHGSAEADRNLRRLLEVTARTRNVSVQLIPTFTYKSHNEGTQEANIKYFNAMFDHVNVIVKEGGYQNVVWEMFNEVVHPLSQHIKDEDVREMLLHVKAESDLPVGTDYHGEFRNEEAWPGRYPFVWRDVVGYIAFHPRRNPEPTFDDLVRAQQRWNYVKPVWTDETVSWASDANIAKYHLQGKGTIAMNGYGTEDERMWQVVRHLKNVYRTSEGTHHWIPFYHSIWLIECAEIGRIPNFDNDIAN